MWQVLLDNGAEIEAREDEGRTPLHFACLEGHVDVVQVGRICSSLWLNQWPEVLLICCASQVLLENGARLEARGLHGRTPLHGACEGGHDEVVKVAVILEMPQQSAQMLLSAFNVRLRCSLGTSETRGRHRSSGRLRRQASAFGCLFWPSPGGESKASH